MSVFAHYIAPIVLVVLNLILFIRRAVEKTKPEARTRWEVRVAARAKWVRTRPDNINDSVEVRLIGPDSDVTMGTIKIADDDYEAQLKDAIARAEERAETLNALVML